jgi:hypothetical protein
VLYLCVEQCVLCRDFELHSRRCGRCLLACFWFPGDPGGLNSGNRIVFHKRHFQTLLEEMEKSGIP